MRPGELAKKIERITAVLLIFSLVGLFLMSFLPWVSVTETNAIRENLVFNFDMMEKSYDNHILGYANQLSLIISFFWIIIILTVITQMGAIIHASGKITFVAQFLLTIGSITIFFSSVIVWHLYDFIKLASGNENPNLAEMFPHFYYAYIPLIFGILTLIYSCRYALIVVTHAIDKYRDSPKEKKSWTEKKKDKKTEKEEKKVAERNILKIQQNTTLDKLPLAPSPNKQKMEMEDWLNEQAEDLEEPINQEEKQEPIVEGTKEEIITEDETKEEKSPEPDLVKEEEGFEKQEGKITKIGVKKDDGPAGPFPAEEPFMEPEDTELPQPSRTFEDALQSAIQRRQNVKSEGAGYKSLTAIGKEKMDEEKKTKEKKEDLKTKEINIRCPKCKHIFTTPKGDGVTHIKCPNCGKEGNINM